MKAQLHVHKILDGAAQGQRHGMPCLCENITVQHVDIERKISVFIQASIKAPDFGNASKHSENVYERNEHGDSRHRDG
jgi:hypothetical protein